MTVEKLEPLLNVEDVERSIAFYRDVAGMRVEEDFEANGRTSWARLGNGAASLMVNRGTVAAAAEPRRARGADADLVLYCSVPDARMLHGELRDRGYHPSDVALQAYGVYEFLLRDPDGYALAFVSPAGQEG